jgi:hypothetical protein
MERAAVTLATCASMPPMVPRSTAVTTADARDGRRVRERRAAARDGGRITAQASCQRDSSNIRAAGLRHRARCAGPARAVYAVRIVWTAEARAEIAHCVREPAARA